MDKKNPTPTPELLTVKDLARCLSLAERTVWRHAGSGLLPKPVRIGTSVRWRAEEVRQWIADGCPIVNTALAEGRAA